jgi:glycosyltransferase involved in cell wall biosynthesis
VALSARQQPTVSVVIPAKDDALFLERCLECLAEQTTPVDELIVVDNGSQDLTPIVAGWWGAAYLYEPTPGIAAAASAGYDAAGCDLIARLDADSEPPPDWVANLVAAFVDDPTLDAITGPGRFPTLPRRSRLLADQTYLRPYFALMGRLLGHPPLFGSNFAMTRKTWRSAGGSIHRRDPEVHDDLDLSFRLPRQSRVLLEPEFTVAISARPFSSPISFARRVRRGVHTVWVNRDVVLDSARPSRGWKAGDRRS